MADGYDVVISGAGPGLGGASGRLVAEVVRTPSPRERAAALLPARKDRR